MIDLTNIVNKEQLMPLIEREENLGNLTKTVMPTTQKTVNALSGTWEIHHQYRDGKEILHFEKIHFTNKGKGYDEYHINCYMDGKIVRTF